MNDIERQEKIDKLKRALAIAEKTGDDVKWNLIAMEITKLEGCKNE